MALVKIDDREIEVPAGETVLRVALNNGIHIPYFCYHPALSIVGKCRMCLIEVQGPPKLQTACSTRIGELPPERKIDGKYDMVVFTKNERVKKAQRAVLEFQLLDHPLDCPICDQAGECELQEYAFAYGASESRLDFEKLHAPKRVEIGPHVVYDAERCIKCTRCIRFCREISGTGELTMVERGVHTIVGTFPGKKLDNPYSVCTVDICPVGALTSKEFRFKERVWFMHAFDSVCPECSRGCSVRMDAFKNEILRLVPRHNPSVNDHWMCDYGRLFSERVRERERTIRPRVRGTQGWGAYTWEEFAPLLVDKSAFLTGEQKRAAVVSGRATLEEMVAFQELSKALFGGVEGIAPLVVEGEDDALLIRRERRPNLKGASMLGIPLSEENEALSKRLKGTRALFVLREDIVGDADEKEAKELEKIISDVETVIVADYSFTRTAALADVFIPLTGWHEMEGTTINFQGVAQKIEQAVIPPKNCKPFFEVVSLWLGQLGMEAPEPSFHAWHSKVREALPALAAHAPAELKPHGIRLEGGEK